MQDCLSESVVFPKLFHLQDFQRPLLLAPHPDDEVFGCGGLLSLWVQAGAQPHVIVLTDGQAQGQSMQRQEESRSAAAILGSYSLEFWDLPDRQLRCTPTFTQRLTQALQAHQADLLLAPALHEPHPDHQACALTALWSVAQLPKAIDLCFYESGTALVHCTHLVDISSVQAQKTQAMQAFSSQVEVHPYASRIAGLNHFRALTLGAQVTAAEGLQYLPLAQQGWAAVLPALDPLFLRQRGQAITHEDLPLVSVLIRTMGGRDLDQAIASVLAQSYPNIELVIVDAFGENLMLPSLKACTSACIRWVNLGRQLPRPQAANAAFDAAQGKYCLFLDDDDIITPNHIEKLVQHLQIHTTFRAVHTDTQVIDSQGQEQMIFDQAWVYERLLFNNTLPIHSVLFERSLVEKNNCRFDETLPVLEDWDFWLQISQFTKITHVPGVSAIYRFNDRSGLHTDIEYKHSRHQWRTKVWKKWYEKIDIDYFEKASVWHAEKIFLLENQMQDYKKYKILLKRESDLNNELQAIYNSRAWRLVQGFRALKSKIIFLK